MDDAVKKLEQYKERLKAVEFRISEFSLGDESTYFNKLSEIKDFSALFGYKNPDAPAHDVLPAFQKVIGMQTPLSITIRNSCYRRTYFYLQQLENCYDEKQKPTNLSKLLRYFEKYRRLKQAYDNYDQINHFLNSAADSREPFSLAPLYETFIDPELFTTLLRLKSLTSLKDDIRETHKQLIEKMLVKLESLLDGHIGDSGELRDTSEFDNTRLVDESNIFWGLRLLYQERKEKSSLGSRFKGQQGFEELIRKLIHRTYTRDSDRPSERRYPKERDLIYEISPEIHTMERTNLYVLFNLLELLLNKGSLSEGFTATVSETINAEIQEEILEKPLPDNLYFLCLKFQCLTRYVHFCKKSETIESQPYSPQNASDQVAVTRDKRYGEKWYQNRTIQASLIGGIFVLIAAFLTNPLWVPQIKKLGDSSDAHKPIRRASATVQVIIKSDEDFDGVVANVRAYLAFMKEQESLLKASTIGYQVKQAGNGQVVYQGNLTMDLGDSAIGHPVSYLKNTDYILLTFGSMPPNSLVLGGRAICTINNVNLEFSIPQQKAENRYILIRDVAEALQVLNEPSG